MNQFLTASVWWSAFNWGGKFSFSSVWTSRDDLTTPERKLCLRKNFSYKENMLNSVIFLLAESRRRIFMMAGLNMVWLFRQSFLQLLPLWLFIYSDSFCYLLLKHTYQQLTCHKFSSARKTQMLHISFL